jgi:hypothetical protein
VIYNHALPEARSREIAGILKTIAKQFDLPRLDENGKVAVSGESAMPITFILRQLTNNRSKEMSFSWEDAARLRMQVAIARLSAIINEQIGPEPSDQGLREFQQVLTTVRTS